MSLKVPKNCNNSKSNNQNDSD
ncbi:hypothetical protein ERY430_70359 [Erythrobacter sp. EC-HK427]|nr:hypothetical protein ERY430_70359 [Erythrobacter sp. EC-HK427]